MENRKYQNVVECNCAVVAGMILGDVCRKKNRCLFIIKYFRGLLVIKDKTHLRILYRQKVTCLSILLTKNFKSREP